MTILSFLSGRPGTRLAPAAGLDIYERQPRREVPPRGSAGRYVTAMS
jgi:hypothetical protein